MPKVSKAISALIKVAYVNIIVSLSAELEALPASKESSPSFFPFYIFMYLSALLWICTLGPSCIRDNTNPVYVRYLCNITPLEILELQGVRVGIGWRWRQPQELQYEREREKGKKPTRFTFSKYVKCPAHVPWPACRECSNPAELSARPALSPTVTWSRELSVLCRIGDYHTHMSKPRPACYCMTLKASALRFSQVLFHQLWK